MGGYDKIVLAGRYIIFIIYASKINGSMPIAGLKNLCFVCLPVFLRDNNLTLVAGIVFQDIFNQNHFLC